MMIPERFHVAVSAHWLISHRIDSALPGYLMVTPREHAEGFNGVQKDALSELGTMLQGAENLLKKVLGAKRVYIGKYGHSSGWSMHFHCIPVYVWIEELFRGDMRYRVLQQFANPQFGFDPDG